MRPVFSGPVTLCQVIFIFMLAVIATNTLVIVLLGNIKFAWAHNSLQSCTRCLMYQFIIYYISQIHKFFRNFLLNFFVTFTINFANNLPENLSCRYIRNHNLVKIVQSCRGFLGVAGPHHG